MPSSVGGDERDKCLVDVPEEVGDLLVLFLEAADDRSERAVPTRRRRRMRQAFLVRYAIRPSALRERLRLDCVELPLGDRSRVEQLLSLGDLGG
jgi:hypothetical protein